MSEREPGAPERALSLAGAVAVPSAAALLPWAGPLPLVAAAALVLARDGLPALRRPAFLAAALLLAASHLAAADAWASAQSLAHWALLALVFGAGAGLARQGRTPVVVGGFLVLATAWTVHALWQALVLFPRLIAEGAAAGSVARAQLADGRPNGTFAVPGHLGALLAAAVLLGLAGGRGAFLAGKRGAALLQGAGAAAALAGFLATRSLAAAGLLGLAAIALGLLAARGRARRVLLVGAPLAALVALVAFLATRADAVRAENPVAARALNWQAALRLIDERPVLGWGGGAFAHEYARVRPAGANDTRHAHQALFEAAAEHGAGFALLLLVPVGLVAAAAARGSAEAGSPALRWARAGPPAAAVVLLGHGLVDFGWSRPEWAVFAALLLGLAAATGSAARGEPPRGRELIGVLALVLLVAGVAAGARTERLAIESVQRLGAEGRHAEAAREAAAARPKVPGSSELPALEAQARLAAGQRSGVVAPCDEAVRLSPRRSVLHALRAQALAAEGRRLEAWLAAERAAALAPTLPERLALRDALRPAGPPR